MTKGRRGQMIRNVLHDRVALGHYVPFGQVKKIRAQTVLLQVHNHQLGFYERLAKKCDTVKKYSPD